MSDGERSREEKIQKSNFMKLGGIFARNIFVSSAGLLPTTVGASYKHKQIWRLLQG